MQTQFDNGLHNDAARELRRLTERQDNGDQLIHEAIGVNAGQVGFSSCAGLNEKKTTEGLKVMLQGLYRRLQG